MGRKLLSIDTASVQDNPAEHQVEFTGEIDGRFYMFAVKYTVLDAMCGRELLAEPAAAFGDLTQPMSEIGLYAWNRTGGSARIVIDDSTALDCPHRHYRTSHRLSS